MTVLIITWSGDNECIENVSRAIEERGSDVFRLDTDRFPTQVQLSASLDADGEAICFTSESDSVQLSDVTAIWHRRLRVAKQLPDSMDEQLRRASKQESHRTLFSAFASVDTFVMDPVLRIRQAEHKQLQLRLARDVGFDIPRTLMSNDPKAVRAFAETCGGTVMTKMLSSFAILEEGAEQVMFTTPLKGSDFDHLDELRFCPMTFQERIEKALELRVTIVGERVFAASIDSQSLERSQTDWRREGRQLALEWKPFELPAEIEQRLLALMDALHLNYGAADLILTPEGRFVFLEVNPSGEFFWIERSQGHAISDAIADLLLDRVPRRDTRLKERQLGISLEDK